MTVVPGGVIKKYCITGAALGIVYIICTLICVYYIDEKLAFFIYNQKLPYSRILNFISERSPYFLIPIEILLLIFFQRKQKFSHIIALIFTFILVTVVADVLKTELKILFGRNWPNVYANDGIHGSLIGNDIYSFHFMEQSKWKGSLPSGHTTFIASTSMFMALLRKRYRYIFWSALPIMGAAIILQNHHFLGDCFSGFALGTFVAYYGYALYLMAKNQLMSKD